MGNKVLNCKINLLKIDKEKHIFYGEKGSYVDFTIAERKELGKNGETHSIYIKKKDQEKVYIGDATIKEFDGQDGTSTPEAQAKLPF